MPRTHSPPGHELDFVISSKYTRTRAHTQQSFHKYLTAQTLSLRLSRSVRVSVSLCTRLEIAFCASARSRKDKWERKKKKHHPLNDNFNKSKPCGRLSLCGQRVEMSHIIRP